MAACSFSPCSRGMRRFERSAEIRCQPVAIVSCTNANPAVCTTDQPHNLTEGETVGIQGGPPSPGNKWATDYGINTDDDAVGGLTAHVVDDTSFTLLRLNGQAIDGAPLGPLPAGMQITYHANCGYEGYVDDYLGKPANLWWPTNNNPVYNGLTPRWRAEVQPPPGSGADYFLNVLYPTTTSTASMPPTALIDVDNYYGVVIRALSPEVALFSKPAEPQTRVDYTAEYDGNARHVITGLKPGRYTITWNGRPLPGNSKIAVAEGGLLHFTSPAGAFSIVGASRPAQ